MQWLTLLKGILVGFWWYTLKLLDQAWWVEIVTVQPRCTYYFGPFESRVEAQSAHQGYVEDLEGEAAQGIAVAIKQCNPTVLTLCTD